MQVAGKPMWNSVESLSYWLPVIRWVTGGAGATAFVAALSNVLVSNRLDELRADRHLSQVQQQKIASVLKRFPGTQYTIWSYPDARGGQPAARCGWRPSTLWRSIWWLECR